MTDLALVLLLLAAGYLVYIGVTMRTLARRALFDLTVLILTAERQLPQARDSEQLRRDIEVADRKLFRAQICMATSHPSMALPLAQAAHAELIRALEIQGLRAAS